MPRKSKHDQVAEYLARLKGTEYNQGRGPDIQTPREVIEVETPELLGKAARQLQGHRKPAYVAVPTDGT